MAAHGRNEGFHVLDDLVCEAMHDPSVPLANSANQGRNERTSVIEELVLKPGKESTSAGVDKSRGPQQTAPTGRRRSWRMFFAGVATAWIIPLVVAFFAGPRYSSTCMDPLTGRVKHTETWIGLTLYDRIEENEVSKWADRNSIPGIYPGQYGWSHVTSTGREWFSRSWIACAGGLDIPARIYRSDIVIEGLTREETLQRYQTELVAYYREHGSTHGIERKWLQRTK